MLKLFAKCYNHMSENGKIEMRKKPSGISLDVWRLFPLVSFPFRGFPSMYDLMGSDEKTLLSEK